MYSDWEFSYKYILSSRILQNNLSDLYSVEICHNKVLFLAKATTNPSRIGVHFLSFQKSLHEGYKWVGAETGHTTG